MTDPKHPTIARAYERLNAKRDRNFVPALVAVGAAITLAFCAWVVWAAN